VKKFVDRPVCLAVLYTFIVTDGRTDRQNCHTTLCRSVAR